LVKIVFSLLLIVNCLLGASKSFYQDKYTDSKKEYLQAIMSSNKDKEVESLKKLILYGKKLNMDTFKYEKELNKIDTKIKPAKKVTTESYFKPKPQPKPTKPKITTRPLTSTIQSVTQDENSITLKFNRRINKSFIDYDKFKDKSFFYDQFDIKGYFKDAAPTKLAMKGVNNILIYQYKNDTLRIRFKNRTNLKIIYIITKNAIIIKVLNLANSVKTQKKAKDVKMLPENVFYPSKKTIVIDPGHGGKDAGAVGKGRLYEKNIVLNIGKYLKKELEKNGFKVYLTRSRDKYIKLPNRTKYANRKDADLFISIHANAVPKSKAHRIEGIETFFLSPARSERAKRVAALENKGDMNNMGWSSKNSLLTILNQSKITASNKAAIDIQKNMLYILRETYGKRTIKDAGVREGPFWVLVGAQMPSVLIEVGYITHPRESRRLKTTKYQKLVAKGIANGVTSYFLKN